MDAQEVLEKYSGHQVLFVSDPTNEDFFVIGPREPVADGVPSPLERVTVPESAEAWEIRSAEGLVRDLDWGCYDSNPVVMVLEA